MINNRLTYDLQSVKQNKIIANAHELLKELPSISSTDGNSLNLAGANGTTILISGKVSSLSTEQLIEYLKTLPAEKWRKWKLSTMLLHNYTLKVPLSMWY